MRVDGRPILQPLPVRQQQTPTQTEGQTVDQRSRGEGERKKKTENGLGEVAHPSARIEPPPGSPSPTSASEKGAAKVNIKYSFTPETTVIKRLKLSFLEYDRYIDIK